ncbi:DUF3958 family protein [Pseudolactococcus reticulitermitis]|uniref:Uncharacterized protein n=1 Tax=Pseudolactococcus reticulitermitis TaxID=2025039 RepID=A0A224XEP3_9LACT|nr:DUF3958 family protein [Lactococcus reticulitermitis]GAX48372.1 hypothetical protein RsY01_1994 [Lactococcus reticulitermitis]GHU36689.1 hypothetical protein FACS1894192_03830 [Bacilli bacterium]
MATWEELNFRERELQEQEDRIMAETQQVESVTEYYRNFSQQEQRFFYDLSEKFYHTESELTSFLNQKMGELDFKTKRILSDLDQASEELQGNRRQIIYDLEELGYDRQKLAFEESEGR